MSNRAIRLIYFLTWILMWLTILFLCCQMSTLRGYLVEAYNYNSELNNQLGQSASAYDDAIKKVWKLEAELDYYKPSYERLERAYNQLLLNPIEVEVPVEVEVVKYRNIFPRQFESVKQFEEWYEAQRFAFLIPQKGSDCDDFAERLQRIALVQGYPVSQALVWWGRYYNTKVSADVRAHAGNLVLIVDTYYYVEPAPGHFKLVKLVDRD